MTNASATLSRVMSAAPRRPICLPKRSRRIVTGLSAITCDLARRPVSGFGSIVTRKSGAITNSEAIRQTTMEAWLTNELRPWFADRLLDVDEDVFVVWRRLIEEGKAARHTFPWPDLFIAATVGLARPMRSDRNVGDFLRTGVSVLK